MRNSRASSTPNCIDSCAGSASPLLDAVGDEQGFLVAPMTGTFRSGDNVERERLNCALRTVKWMVRLHSGMNDGPIAVPSAIYLLNKIGHFRPITSAHQVISLPILPLLFQYFSDRKFCAEII